MPNTHRHTDTQNNRHTDVYDIRMTDAVDIRNNIYALRAGDTA